MKKKKKVAKKDFVYKLEVFLGTDKTILDRQKTASREDVRQWIIKYFGVDINGKKGRNKGR
jgi:hypothetical protein